METRNANAKAIEVQAQAAPALIALLALSLLTVALTSVGLASPHPAINAYFPLDLGNRWVYMQSVQGLDRPARIPNPMEVVRVVGRFRTEEGAEVFQVTNYTFRLGKGTSQFAELNGRVVEFRGMESGLWYQFDTGAQVALPFRNDHPAARADAGQHRPSGGIRNCLDIQYSAVPAPGRPVSRRAPASDERILSQRAIETGPSRAR
jgi:hypothetical protein